MRRSIPLLAALMLASTKAPAQTGMANHVHHAAEAKFRELPAPPIMSGIGDARLKITTLRSRHRLTSIKDSTSALLLGL
jgi:hypothetical protein